jgi:E3 ubiquitin-protein ligase HUWE1
MAREIFNPNLALFVSVPEGGTTFQPNPNSIVQNDTGVSHLEFFKFVGRVVGKALYDGQLMDAYFTRSFYKHMLGQPLTYEVRSGRGLKRGEGGHVAACDCVVMRVNPRW